MNPGSHVIVSLILSSALWFFTKSIYAGLLCFFSGLAIDLDHIIEYIIHYDWKNFSFKKLYQMCEQTRSQEGEHRFKKVYLIFHVAEIAILLWIISLYTKNIYLLAVTLGYSVHLFMDYTGNKTYLRAYFIVWRIINNFNVDRFFRKM